MCSRLGFDLFRLVGWKNTFEVFRWGRVGFHNFWMYVWGDTFARFKNKK